MGKDSSLLKGVYLHFTTMDQSLILQRGVKQQTASQLRFLWCRMWKVESTNPCRDRLSELLNSTKFHPKTVGNMCELMLLILEDVHENGCPIL